MGQSRLPAPSGSTSVRLISLSRSYKKVKLFIKKASSFAYQHRDPLRVRPEDHTVVVTVARDLLVHHKAPLEGDSVESLGPLGAHHVSSHTVQVDMFGVDSFPDGPVGSPVFSPSSPVRSEHVAQVAGQLHLLYEPAAVDLQLLEVFTIAQAGSEGLKLLRMIFSGVLRGNVTESFRP